MYFRIMDNSTLDDHFDVFKSKYTYSTFLERAISSVVDSVVLIVPNLGMDFLLKNHILSSVISNLLGILYFALMESGRNQATLRKMIYQMKVVDYTYQRLSFSQALTRAALKYAGSLVYLAAEVMYSSQIGAIGADSPLLKAMGIMMLISLTDVLWAFSNTEVQTLHDKIARTYVMKSEASL